MTFLVILNGAGGGVKDLEHRLRALHQILRFAQNDREDAQKRQCTSARKGLCRDFFFCK